MANIPPFSDFIEFDLVARAMILAVALDTGTVILYDITPEGRAALVRFRNAAAAYAKVTGLTMIQTPAKPPVQNEGTS